MLLLCTCVCAAALLQRVLEPNGTSRLQIVQQPQQTPVQLDAVRQMLPQAEDCWWAPGHIGWALFDPQTGDAVQVGGLQHGWAHTHVLVVVCMCQGPERSARRRLHDLTGATSTRAWRHSKLPVS